MDTEKIVLEIADRSLSVSRILKIAKALYGVALDPSEVWKICEVHRIPTPKRVLTGDPLEDAYPDKYSLFLEAVTFWVRVRRYWGDPAAAKLQAAIAVATDPIWRGLQVQFGEYTNPAILDRKEINLNPEPIDQPLEIERLYASEIQKDMFLRGYQRELQNHPDPVLGAKFPIASPDWHEFKQQELKSRCLTFTQRDFPTAESVIQYFGEFWADVYRNRGEVYFNHLKADLVGRAEQQSRINLYSSTELWFRWFLRNLEGFKSKAPWRIPINQEQAKSPLPMPLEGLVLREGWQNVRNMAALGTLRV